MRMRAGSSPMGMGAMLGAIIIMEGPMAGAIPLIMAMSSIWPRMRPSGCALECTLT